MQWMNEPPRWAVDGDVLTVTTGPETDFWRKTRTGSIRDNGHFYYETVTGDFIATVKLTGQYASLYDQAGLMLRRDETTWIKCGIEFVEGVQYVSAVVTRDFSDWSVLPLLEAPESIWIQVRRQGGMVEVFFSLDNATFVMVRRAHLSAENSLDVGMMAACPKGDAFTVTFEGYTRTAPA